VLFFRLPGAPLQTKIDQLNAVLENHAAELSAGEFLVVTAGQIRVAGRSPLAGTPGSGRGDGRLYRAVRQIPGLRLPLIRDSNDSF